MSPVRFILMYSFPCFDEREQSFLSYTGLIQMARERPFLTSVIVQETSDKPESGTRPGHLSLHIPDNSEGLKLGYKDLTAPECNWTFSYEELRAAGMPLSRLDGQIFASMPYRVLAPEDKAMAFQVTIVPGGCFLSASSVHNFVDAFSLVSVMHEWARNCQE